VDASYTYQFAGQNGGAQSALRAFDAKQNNDFNINAVKVAIEKPLSDKNEFTAGFRADVVYGEDAQVYNNGGDTGKGGLGFAGDQIALEQGYVQFRAPIGNGLDFKFGRFATPVGFEVFERPLNMNFSHGLLYWNFQPLNHTGLLASYKFNDLVDAQFGIVDGWNNVNSASTLDGSKLAKAFLGRVNLTAPGANANLAQTLLFSPDGELGYNNTPVTTVTTNGVTSTPTGFTSNPSTTTFAPVSNGSVLLYDVVGLWAPKFADGKLSVGFDLDYLAIQTSGRTNTDDSYGAALYTKYQFTKILSLAGRGEYAHGNILGGNVNNKTDGYSFTLTAGFDLWQNMVTRVEYRLDQADNGVITNKDQHQIALNMIYSF
jgi:hypothetical protein